MKWVKLHYSKRVNFYPSSLKTHQHIHNCCIIFLTNIFVFRWLIVIMIQPIMSKPWIKEMSDKTYTTPTKTFSKTKQIISIKPKRLIIESHIKKISKNHYKNQRKWWTLHLVQLIPNKNNLNMKDMTSNGGQKTKQC